MSAPKCKACGGAYRKGTRRLLLEQDGTTTAAFVCPSCARRAVQIVAPLLPIVAPKAADAEVLFFKNALRRAKRTLTLFIATARNNVRAEHDKDKAQFFDGRASGLEMALGLVETIAEGRMP